MANAAQTATWRTPFAGVPGLRSPAAAGVTRFLVALAVALLGFGVVLLLQGRNPVQAYTALFVSTLGTPFGRSEVLVKAIPLLLCPLSVAVPARVGLVNVGGEGQLYLGAWLASGVALTFTDLPIWLVLPLMLVATIGA